MTEKALDLNEIVDTLAEMIANKKEIDVAEIKPDSKLLELGLDSLDTFDLIFNAEYHFDVKFPKEYGVITTLNDVAELTHELIQQKLAA
jgi:acyl carrier protein